MNEKNYEYAINLYLALHDKHPKDAQVSFYLAKAYFRAGQYDQCESVTRKCILRNPNEMRLKFNLALCLNNRAQKTFEMPIRKVSQTEATIKDLHSAKSLLTEILQLSQKTGGNPADYILPANSTRESIQQTNSMYGDMCRVAESTLTYLQ